MRFPRSFVCIVGIFQALVIQAQSFGTTEVHLFDRDFLLPAATQRPVPEAALPLWYRLGSVTPASIDPILPPSELFP